MLNMKKTITRVLAIFQACVLTLGIMSTNTAAIAQGTGGMWLTGDFHTHTYLSDGSYTAAQVAQKAKQFGLDWYSAADHGGGTTGGRDENGVTWPETTTGLVDGKLPRWASISGIGQQQIDLNRSSILQFTGFEWNVPTHEHASVGIVGTSETAKNALAIFDYIFDASKEAYNNTSPLFAGLGIERGMDGKTEMKLDNNNNLIAGDAKVFTYNSNSGAIAGAKYLQDKFPSTSYFLPNHPSRALNYTAASFKEFYDVAPDVCFGAELLPGHQASAYRGGLGYVTVYDSVLKKNVNISSKSGTTLQEKLTSYVASLASAEQAKYTADIQTAMLTSLTTNEPLQRTYGGADYMLAKIGGVWDTMLSEGRRFWVFGNSDFHIDSEKAATQAGSEPDFWPGEYSKNYTYTYGKDYQSILDGMRSGNSYTVLGDLINALDYKVTNNNTSATMGEYLTPITGKETVMTIRFKSPTANNNGVTPVVDHIDLIAGEVKGEPATKYVDSSQTNITSFVDPNQYLTAEYRNDDVTATTSVIKRINRSEFVLDQDGYMTATFTIPASSKNMYYRLRGTNNAVGTANVDANGNPAIDTALGVFAGDNTVQKAYSDLWFYTNPVFVNAQADGTTISGVLKDTSGNVLANKTIELHSTTQVTTTDSTGKYTFNNVELGIHTLYVKNANGDIESQITFNLQRGTKTEFSLGDVWIASGVTNFTMNFTVSGNTILISSVTGNKGSINPKTGDSNNLSWTLSLIALSLVMGIGIVLLNRTQKVRR